MGKRADGGEKLIEVDMLIEVLSRLRVKPLLRFKSVSKSWYSLISSPNFVKSHLQRAMTSYDVDDDEENNLIVHLYRDGNRLKYKKEDGSFSLFNLGYGQIVTNLKFPYPQGEYPVDPPSILVGFVCGIACVCVDDSDYFGKSWLSTANNPSNIYLWNPSIKQSKLIPPHTIHDDKTKVSLGFGFDPIDFDFKVVRVVRNVSSVISPEVYSLNRDAWQKIDSYLSDVPFSSNFEVCLHGFLFTTGYNGMIAFDLKKEVFVCDIKLPATLSGARVSGDARILDFKDSIAVIISKYAGLDTTINLWTLDDEACLRGGGVEASWTVKLIIGLGDGLYNILDLSLLANGWFFYKSNKNVVKYIFNNPYIDIDEGAFKYTESLLSFAGSKQVKWSADEDDRDESCVDSEYDNKQNSVELEDDEVSSDYSEDDNEESTTDSEDDEVNSDDSEDDREESATDSEDDSEESYEDDLEESSEDDNGECSGDSASE